MSRYDIRNFYYIEKISLVTGFDSFYLFSPLKDVCLLFTFQINEIRQVHVGISMSLETQNILFKQRLIRPSPSEGKV